MSKDKKNLADLLEEYFPGAGQQAEQVLNDMFGGQSSETAEKEVPEEEPAEIITDDGDEDDTPDVPDEPFEIPEADEDEAVKFDSAELSTLSQWSDWADETIAANASFDGKDTAEATASEADDETETAPEAEDMSEVSEEDDAEKEEITKITENEDINDKWLVRAAKGIFPFKGDSVFEVIRKIIFLAAIIVFIGAGIMLASTLIQSKKAVEIQSSMRDLIETTVATYIDTDGSVVTVPPTPEEIAEHNKQVVENVKDINDDYIGFLEIAGCEIFEPVVKGEDNDYYLRNNIYGEPNKAGAIFMDYRCTVTEEYTSPNIVLYGHNQEDGTMFGHLKYYKIDYTKENPSPSFYIHNPTLKFNPEFENGEYLIYGFFVTNALENQDSNGEVFHYHDYIETMSDERTFNWYQGEVQKRNQIISPVDVKYGDKLLVLSTCSNEFTNSRFVVFARKLREGESVSDYDFSETRLNPNARGVDWEAIMSGETSATTVPEGEEILDESTTHRKSLNKRNEKTYTTASEEETTVTETAAETTAEAVSTTVPVSEESETETETAGSSEDTEAETSADGDETTVQTDENGSLVTEESDSESSEASESETTAKKKKKTETSASEEAVTSKKKKSSKSNK